MSDFEDAILKSGGLPNAAPAEIAKRMFDQVSKGEISEYTFGTLQQSLASAMNLSLSDFFMSEPGRITLANRPLYPVSKQIELMKAEGFSPRAAQAAHEEASNRSARNEDFQPRHSDARHNVNGESDAPETASEEGSYPDGDYSQKAFGEAVQAYMRSRNMVDADKHKAEAAIGSEWHARDKARKGGESKRFSRI